MCFVCGSGKIKCLWIGGDVGAGMGSVLSCVLFLGRRREFNIEVER